MKQKTWIAVILLGTVAVNGVAYLALRARRASVPATYEGVPPPAAPARAAAAQPPAAPAPAAPLEEDANAGLARARRAAGLAALEDRDYDKAISEFTEALSLRKDKGDLVELMRIASDLRTREQARAKEETAKHAQAPAAPARPAARPKPTRLAARTQPREEPQTPAEEARGGLLLVTSTPPGLVVLVDGKAMDLTPARMPLRAGTYRVALAQGERRLIEETVEVGEDTVRSLNRDLTAELAPPPTPARAAPAPPPAVAAAAPAPTTVPASAEATPRSESQVVPAVARAAVAGKGSLDITSPALYGEIWVNSRPYGFPPVTAKDLPAGPAKVEVRVNGEVKRRMTVQVAADSSTPVRVR
ncbi:PEGA domain-containing protein [Myxococcaceae bacterium GXIMD 01537]